MEEREQGGAHQERRHELPLADELAVPLCHVSLLFKLKGRTLLRAKLEGARRCALRGGASENAGEEHVGRTAMAVVKEGRVRKGTEGKENT